MTHAGAGFRSPWSADGKSSGAEGWKLKAISLISQFSMKKRDKNKLLLTR
jgi:hypothetical protein